MTHPANPCTPKRSKSQIQIIFLILNCNHPTKQVTPIKIKTHTMDDNGKPHHTSTESTTTTLQTNHTLYNSILPPLVTTECHPKHPLVLHPLPFYHAESNDARCHLLL